jgi:hypothetical protein
MAFLAVEALFYLKTFATGAAFFQLQNHSDLLRVIFVIGYVSGLTAAIYLIVLWRHPPSRAPRPDGGLGGTTPPDRTTSRPARDTGPSHPSDASRSRIQASARQRLNRPKRPPNP